MEAVRSGQTNWLSLAFRPLRDMLVFAGRSTRSEVIAFFVLNALANMVTLTIDGRGELLLAAAKLLWILLWSFAWLALFVRRLHDQERSGWWATLWVVLVALMAAMLFLPESPDSNLSVQFLSWRNQPAWTGLSIGLMIASLALIIGQLVLFFVPGSPGLNSFGPDPRLAAD